jgi:hypothetical protein
MKAIKRMSQPEIGAFVISHLQRANISVVLSGGAVVAIYSQGRYVSKDLDLVNMYFSKPEKIKELMAEIGFVEVGRHYKHPDSEFFIEFPPGPLNVGDEPVQKIFEMKYDSGLLKLISPTDCVKDRLASYYHFGDQQCLAQAILVANNQKIDLEEVKRWSRHEGKLREFEQIASRLIRKNI